MKKFLLTIGAVLAFVSVAIAGPWSTTCTFQSDNTCTFDMSPQPGLVPGFGIVDLFVPATADSGSTTLTMTLSPDGVTYFAPYSGSTAYDTYTGSTSADKAYGMYLDGAYYIKLTASDNAFLGVTLTLQGRY